MSTATHEQPIGCAPDGTAVHLPRGRANVRSTRRAKPFVALGVAVAIVLGVGAEAGPRAAATTGVPTAPGPVVAAPNATDAPAGQAAGVTFTRASGPITFPVGLPSATEPSGLKPPGAHAIHGYALAYETDFAGTTLPRGWAVFNGQPGGDPGALWAASHVTVRDGTLRLHAWRDPAFGDEWVTGGVCHCAAPAVYGAYFVRSRVTGPGPAEIDLLWPANNAWPPEVDFNESWGPTWATGTTDHFGAFNSMDQHHLYVDLTRWHTFGVVWTPKVILYVVDGRVWASIKQAQQIPHVPMTLDLTQQTWCSKHWACPTSGQMVSIDWVAEYHWVGTGS